MVGVGVAVFVTVAVAVLVGVELGVRVGVSVAVFVGVAVGVAVGVSVGVAVGVFVRVAVAVPVGVGVRVLVGKASTMVLVGVGVLVPVGVGVAAGRRGTATMDHGRALPNVQDIVVELAPGSVLPAPNTLLELVPVPVLYCWVCPDPTVSVVLPFAVTASTTSWPVLLATVTLGVPLVPVATAGVPSGVV